MRKRRDLPVRPLYTSHALAAFMGIGRPRLRRLLEAYGVRTLEADGSVWIPLVEIERRLEPLWDSIVRSARMAGGIEEEEEE